MVEDAIAIQQAELLQYARLRDVLGDAFVKFATDRFGTEVDVETQWGNIFNPNVSYNAPQKRDILRCLSRLVHKQPSASSSDLLMVQLFNLDQATKEVVLTRIEEVTVSYFQKQFPKCDVAFDFKKGGDQLGRMAVVTLNDGRQLTYHIKTHAGGLKSDHSSAATLVNPAELLVYKVLECLGVGCECHFFGRNGYDLYIATLDAGLQIHEDGTVTKAAFHEYTYFKNAKDPAIQRQLWGCLADLPPDVHLSSEQYDAIEANINTDPVAQQFVYEVAKLDLLARILRLTDFQTNAGNYGFVQMKDTGSIASTIDFRVLSTDPNELRFSEYFFSGFLNGNGYFNYSSTGAAMYYALRKRQRALRVDEARKVMAKLSAFEAVVDTACQSVAAALFQVPMGADDQMSIHQNLTEYAEIIKSNFGLFRDKLAT